jgi:hypothetical protein
VICPCKAAGNPRDHGRICHYKEAGLAPKEFGPPGGDCSLDGLSVTIFHDKRCCVAVCAHHARWRSKVSQSFGHSRGCPMRKPS